MFPYAFYTLEVHYFGVELLRMDSEKFSEGSRRGSIVTLSRSEASRLPTRQTLRCGLG